MTGCRLTARRALQALAIFALLASTAGGCIDAPSPPQPEVANEQPAPPPQTPEDKRAEDHSDDEDVARREARAAAVRLRATGSAFYGPHVGSGFAVDPHTVVTNAHVVAGSERVDVSAWDGEEAHAASGRMAVRQDLAAITTTQQVPATPLELAHDELRPGQQVTVVGFPGGGQLTVQTDASVVDLTRQAPAPMGGPVIAIDADSVEPGSSGGPVLNRDGEVVAIVFAIERATGQVMAIPASTARSWLDSE